MAAYYNEFDPFAAAWLRELIKAGHIADGVVDDRSILDVQPEDLKDFAQCHFFAGIGGWSVALRQAMWRDDRHVWTGSCPCQPFSTAGKQGGATDERHLWPVWLRLIRECRPDIVFGEQVAGAAGFGWLDAVSTDRENEDYACGSAVLGAHSVGAPHIRQRLWFVADTMRSGRAARGSVAGNGQASERGTSGELADSASKRLERPARTLLQGSSIGPAGSVTSGELADTDRRRQPGQGPMVRPGDTEAGGNRQEHRVVNDCRSRGDWSGTWHGCQDSKRRKIPAEPSLFPLVDGVQPARVGILRGAGNAIVPQVAAEFIKAFLDVKST